MNFQTATALLVCLTTLPLPAFADAGGGETIIVTGHIDGYRTIDTTSGTKTNIAILDVPQSITVVTAAQLNDQAIRSVADLVRLLPGVSAGQGEGNRDQITLRGNNSTADFFVDGLRDDVQYSRSFYNIDRIEAHKGPNATIFGRGGGGGIINRITKGVLINQTLVAASASVDSFGAWYGSADLNTDVGPFAVRLNGYYEQLNNHRNSYNGDRYGINPVLGAAIGASTKVQLGYEYVRDTRVSDRGVPSAFTGTIATPAGPLPGYRDIFFGVEGINNVEAEGQIIRWSSVSKISDTLSLTTAALYSDFSKIYTNVFAATAVGGTAAAPTIGVEAYSDPATRQTAIAQANLEWRTQTGGIGHVILIGGEYTVQDQANERINGFFDRSNLSAANRRATVALSRSIVVPRVYFVRGPAGNANRSVSSKLNQSSFYVQDQISFGKRVEVIAGLRYDRFDLGITDIFSGGSIARVDTLWSPRIGLVYKPVPQASIYASYTRSYLPQSGDQFRTFSPTLATLKPESFDNYEIGAKWDIKPGLTGTIAVYRLDRGNTTAVVNNATVQTGAQRSSGMELGLTGRITSDWQMAFGYARTKALITATTTAAPRGREVAQVPRHQVSLWNRYEATSRVGLGLGIYHQAKSFTSISNTTIIPAYTRVDAALFIKLTDRIEAQLNVENITNETYFPVAHNDFNISPGAPQNARLTINARF